MTIAQRMQAGVALYVSLLSISASLDHNMAGAFACAVVAGIMVGLALPKDSEGHPMNPKRKENHDG